jgi:hypothetical protein
MQHRVDDHEKRLTRLEVEMRVCMYVLLFVSGSQHPWLQGVIKSMEAMAATVHP